MTDDAGSRDLPKGKGGAGRWTFEAASRILPDVRRHTQRARASYGPLRERRDGHPKGTLERAEAEQGMRRCLSQWVRQMEALGVRVRGLWRVEFETESGAFPWRWPEQSLRTLIEDDEETSIH